MPLGSYRVALDEVLQAATVAIARLIQAAYTPGDREASVRHLAPALSDTVREYRGRAYEQAITLIRGQAAAQGIIRPYLPIEAGYPQQSVERILREELRGSLPEATARVSARLAQHVEDAARQTVIRTVEDGRTPALAGDREHISYAALPASSENIPREQRAQSWARVLTGAENCGFCVMLASRGPVYASAADAGRLKASIAFREAGALGYINRYHVHCDCLVVPIYSYAAWPGRTDYLNLQQLYQQIITSTWTDKHGRVRKGITATYGPGTAKNKVIAAFDRELASRTRTGQALPVPALRTQALRPTAA